MNTYVIRINTIDNLYAYYMVEAKNLEEAKLKAQKAFFRDYPGADLNIKLSLSEPNPKIITEIINIIREGNNGRSI